MNIMGWFFRSGRGGVRGFNPYFVINIIPQQLEILRQWVNLLSIISVFAIFLYEQVINIFPWNNHSVVYRITYYSIPYQSMKPPIWMCIHPFPPHLCCWWSIKIIYYWQRYNTNCFCLALYIPPTNTIICFPHKLHNILHSIIYISPSGEML